MTVLYGCIHGYSYWSRLYFFLSASPKTLSVCRFPSKILCPSLLFDRTYNNFGCACVCVRVSVFQLLDEFHLDLLQLKRSFLCFWGVGILQNIFVLYKYMLYIVGVCVCTLGCVCVSICAIFVKLFE